VPLRIVSTASYFLPEDGDTELNPNVFLAPKPRQQGAPPTLGEVKHAFPLPGKYHFRFKSALVPGGDREKNCVAVWMDCVDDRQSIPMWRNAVIAKVTRISDEEEDDDDDEEETYGSTPSHQSHHQAPPPQQQATPAPVRHAAPDLDIFGGGNSHSAPPSVPVSASNSMHNFLDAPVHTSTPGPSLLDMHAPISHSNSMQSVGSTANDFLGMHNPSTPAPSSYGHGQQQHQTPAAFPGYQQPQQTPVTLPRPPGSNAFDSFTTAAKPADKGAFGGLEWNM
jgi:hypothetical protein